MFLQCSFPDKRFTWVEAQTTGTPQPWLTLSIFLWWRRQPSWQAGRSRQSLGWQWAGFVPSMGWEGGSGLGRQHDGMGQVGAGWGRGVTDRLGDAHGGWRGMRGRTGGYGTAPLLHGTQQPATTLKTRMIGNFSLGSFIQVYFWLFFFFFTFYCAVICMFFLSGEKLQSGERETNRTSQKNPLKNIPLPSFSGWHLKPLTSPIGAEHRHKAGVQRNDLCCLL